MLKKYLISIFIWQFITSIFVIPSHILPSFSGILVEFLNNYNVVLYALFITLIEVLSGLFCAIVFCYFVAQRMYYSLKFKRFFIKLMRTIQTIPSVVIAPILITWFGFSIFSKIFLVFIYASYPMLININSHFKQITDEHILYFKTLNSTKRDVYIYLICPLIKEGVLSGLKIASTYAIATALTSELIGAKNGLGVLLADATQNYNYEMIYVVCFVVIISTNILVKNIKHIERVLR